MILTVRKMMIGRQSTDTAVDISADISTEATYSTHDPKNLGYISTQLPKLRS